jgi:hypothetical protein
MEVCMLGNLEASVKVWASPRMHASEDAVQPRSENTFRRAELRPSLSVLHRQSLLSVAHAGACFHGAPSARRG